MKRLALISVLLSLALSASAEKEIIMTVAGENVTLEEFEYLYHKNRRGLGHDMTPGEYMELFKVYRLKVADAKSLGLDTTAAFRDEMTQYRREIMAPYLMDSTFVSSLIEEAVRRSRVAVEARHIMKAKTRDKEEISRSLTLLDSLSGRIAAGDDFGMLARNYSDDDYTASSGGNLGFIHSGEYPYDFETAVYATPEGNVSEIVETPAGYHLVMSGRRKILDTEDVPEEESVRGVVMRALSSPLDDRYRHLREHRDSVLALKHGTDSESLVEAEERWLYNHDADYRNLMNEFHDGSLLYEVSLLRIWGKKEKDGDMSEEEWIRQLKDRYTVTIYEDVLGKVK